MRTAESTTIGDSLPLERIRAVLQEHPVQLAILFGSHVTETTHEASDIDIAVEFDGHRPVDRSYNEAFFGLSADLSETLGTDSVDLVDVHAISPALAEPIFDRGVLLVGDQERATELRRQLTATAVETQSPRERLDTALARIEDHFDGDGAVVSATGESERDG